MSHESATEPKNMAELCAMQEQLLQRCLELVETIFGDFIPHFYSPVRAQHLLDDLRAHVDPDAPPPADARALAQINAALRGELVQALSEVTRLKEWVALTAPPSRVPPMPKTFPC